MPRAWCRIIPAASACSPRCRSPTSKAACARSSIGLDVLKADGICAVHQLRRPLARRSRVRAGDGGAQPAQGAGLHPSRRAELLPGSDGAGHQRAGDRVRHRHHARHRAGSVQRHGGALPRRRAGSSRMAAARRRFWPSASSARLPSARSCRRPCRTGRWRSCSDSTTTSPRSRTRCRWLHWRSSCRSRRSCGARTIPFRFGNEYVKALAAFGFSDSDLGKIDRENALALLPRLKAG